MASLGTVNIVGYPTNPADGAMNPITQAVAFVGRSAATLADPADLLHLYTQGVLNKTMTPNGGKYTKFPTAP
jgi:hypothetical protein